MICMSGQLGLLWPRISFAPNKNQCDNPKHDQYGAALFRGMQGHVSKNIPASLLHKLQCPLYGTNK